MTSHIGSENLFILKLYSSKGNLQLKLYHIYSKCEIYVAFIGDERLYEYV